MRINVMKSAYNLFEYLLALVIILNCRSMWLHITSTRDWFGKLLFYLLIVAVLGCIFFKRKIKVINIKKSIIYVSATLAYSLVFAVLSGYNTSSFIKLVFSVCILLVYFFLCVENGQIAGLFIKYKNLIVTIAIVSLFFWFFGSFLGLIKPTGTVYYNWLSTEIDTAAPSYFGVYFHTQSATLLDVFRSVRNTAIFTEAPMASLHFCVAFLIETLLNKNGRVWKCVVLLIAILSTLSTTGYVLAIFALTTIFLLSKPKLKLLYYIKVIMIPVGVVASLLIAYTLLASRLGTIGSGSIRMDDFRAGFEAWRRNFLFGAGYNNNDYIIFFMSNWRSYNTGFSNSIMQILAQGGIYMGIIYLFGFLRGVISNVKKKHIRFSIFALFIFYLFVVTVITYNYLTIVLLLFINFSNVDLKKIT